MRAWIGISGLLTSAVALIGCGSDRLAGGSGSETTNTLSVRVLDESGQPQVGARVYVRSPEDSTSASARISDADGNVLLDLESPGSPKWIEAVASDGRAGLRVERAFAGDRLQVRITDPGELHLSGFSSGASVSLPGLGRHALADESGMVRFQGLPPGAARIRWSGFDAPVPVVSNVAAVLDAARRGSDFAWPVDGSHDSLAVRRYMDLAGLGDVPTDSVSKFMGVRRARLDLSGRGLDSLPSSIDALNFVQEIDVERNRLVALPSGLARMSRVTVVLASSNPFTAFPTALQGLHSLQILKLDTTRIAEVPGWIADLSALRILGLGYGILDSLPSRLPELRSLSVLNIAQNRIAALPEGMHRMDSLLEIWAETNALRRLPDSIVLAPRLRTMQLDKNPLDSLPSRLGNLATLRDLRLSSTPLRSLPVSLMQLPLEKLDIWNVALCSLDPSLEPWLDSLSGTEWRSVRTASCP